jgi:hypothetical protein
MKESHSEILARYAGPESYAGGGNTTRVATTGVHLGPEIELRKEAFSVCPHSQAGGRQHQADRPGKIEPGHGGVKGLAHGWKLRAREPGDPTSLSEEVADSGPKTPQEAQRA